MAQEFLDTLEYSLKRYAAIKPAMAFKAKSKAEALKWQAALREKIREVIGGIPKPCALKARITSKTEFPLYTRETVVFDSQPDLSVFSYLLLPKGSKVPRPVVLCIPGHGRGVDSIVGLDAQGMQRPWGQWGEYQKDFALQCVANGFAVLAIEVMGFGHCRDQAAVKRGIEHTSCQPAAGAALMFGETITAWRVNDAIRAIDYLETRKEVDTKKLGIMGISGGGLVTFFTSAIDERPKVTVVSGYFNSFKDCVISLSHCIDNYIPGMVNVAEMSDIAGLIAPRHFFVESGTADPIFPVAATKAAYSKAQKIFKVFGAEKKMGIEIFEGDHQFSGKKALPFLKEHL